MHLLLPPSETKRAGGAGAPLVLGELRYDAVLAAVRDQTTRALVALSERPDAARILKLSARQLGEVEVNAAFFRSPTMPAIDRYTGVLFDALDASSLDDASRSWLGQHVDIHSAPLGPVGALDGIPAYRLAAGVRLPELGTLRSIWAALGEEALSSISGVVLDLRSEAYAALGPASSALYVRVVTEGADGQSRALNHFNKKAKGLLTRALAQSSADFSDRAGLFAWGEAHGFDFRDAPSGDEVQLVWNEVPLPAS